MFSVICVYNDSESLNTHLLKGLKKQSSKFEEILIDNSTGKFSSSAEALNYGASLASGDYLMFIHQDVEIEYDYWLEDVHNVLDSLPNLGIAGVAGVVSEGETTIDKYRNIIKHEIPPKEWGNKIFSPELVETLDECLLIIPKTVFNKLEFDDTTCNGWHLYGVDYCLSAHEMGFNVFVLPFSIYHCSQHKYSNFDIIFKLKHHPDGYYPILHNVIKKHKDSFDIIHTTCGEWDTKKSIIFQRFTLTFNACLNFIKRKL